MALYLVGSSGAAEKRSGVFFEPIDGLEKIPDRLNSRPLSLPCSLAPSDRGLGARTDRLLDDDVEQRGTPGSERAFERRRQILGALDELAVTAQAFDDY